MSQFFDEKMETMPEGEMKKFQLEKLKDTLQWVYERVPFYKSEFDRMGLKASSLNKLEDLANFPFTIKNDLRDNYPFGLCAAPMEDIVRHPRLLRDHGQTHNRPLYQGRCGAMDGLHGQDVLGRGRPFQ